MGLISPLQKECHFPRSCAATQAAEGQSEKSTNGRLFGFDLLSMERKGYRKDLMETFETVPVCRIKAQMIFSTGSIL